MSEIYVKKTIGGINVELEKYDETVNGYCSKKVNGVEYTGSIAMLDATGTLEDDYGNEIDINPDTINMIVKWAEKNGW